MEREDAVRGVAWGALWEGLWTTHLAVLSVLILGGLVLLYMGESPAHVYALLLKGSLGGGAQISATLSASTPYLFCGLALAFGFRAGLLNIGAEGQMFAGAILAALWGRSLTLPGSFVWLLLAAAVAGALWAMIPALLKVRFGIHEVICTIMLNYIVFAAGAWLVRQPQIRVNPTIPRTYDVASAAQLSPISLGWLRIDVGLLLGVLLAWGLWRFLRDARLGYEIRVVGLQSEAARHAGIPIGGRLILAFAVSGALAGLAGGLYVASPLHPYFEPDFSPGWGFWGIALALLARNHPLGVVPAALLFGMLETGASVLDTTRGIPREMVQILEVMLILLMSTRLFRSAKGGTQDA
ncbi:MAG: ABC transporter permease [Myxococcales bacterium]|nr:ABC transporter permease [Myxococcales bacterium]